jgi:hypothetical protein
LQNGGAGRSFKHKHTADCKKTQYLEEITFISDIIASYIAVIIHTFARYVNRLCEVFNKKVRKGGLECKE